MSLQAATNCTSPEDAHVKPLNHRFRAAYTMLDSSSCLAIFCKATAEVDDHVLPLQGFFSHIDLRQRSLVDRARLVEADELAPLR